MDIVKANSPSNLISYPNYISVFLQSWKFVMTIIEDWISNDPDDSLTMQLKFLQHFLSTIFTFIDF